VWDGALVLSRYVEFLGSDYFSGKKCIELGSGTGLVGIVAGAVSNYQLLDLHAQLGADIVLTDKQSLLPLIQHNVDKNIDNPKVQVKELFWGTGNPFSTAFDIVLGKNQSELFFNN
jgi:predicted nicotinamide N-methyase